MANIWVQEEYVTVEGDKRYGSGSDDPQESRFDNKGDLFRFCLREFGRCVSKVYVGEKNPRAIGWVFEKRVKYTDSDKTYLQEAWITLHTAPPVRSIKYNYLEAV